jgi:hypothetical protein
MKWLRISLSLFLLFFALSPAQSQESSLSVQEQMQSGLLTLRLQINNCRKEILRLEELLQTTKESDQAFIDSLNQQLAEQKATLEKHSKQLIDSLNYQRRLETENDIWWIADGIIGAGLIAYGIWKQEWIPITAGAAMAGSCILHFVLDFP